MRNKHFLYFDDFVIIFGKNKATGERATTATDTIEKTNDEDEDFVDANDNYHEEPQKGKEEENRENIVVSTCNIAIATSKRNQTSKKKVKSSDGTSNLVEQLVGFQKAY